MNPEERAPGWRVRCMKCGFTEPWGKYGIRLGAVSWMNFTIGRCAKCRRIGFHVIERTPEAAKTKGQDSKPEGPGSGEC